MAKKNNGSQNKKRIKMLSLAAILSALSVVILYVGSVIDVLDLTVTAVTSVIVVFAVIEMNHAYPWMIYATTSVLSVLLLPNKLTALMYVFFGGIYPIAKARFERMHYIVCWILKLSFFNTILLALITVANYVLHLPDTGIDFKWPVFVFGNLIFLLYDFTLTQLISFYLIKVRKMMKLGNYFEN